MAHGGVIDRLDLPAGRTDAVMSKHPAGELLPERRMRGGLAEPACDCSSAGAVWLRLCEWQPVDIILDGPVAQ